MRACLFGTYNRNHSANRIYAAAARAAGYEVIEIHEPLWERTRDKKASYFAPFRLMVLGVRWLAAALRLVRRWRSSGGARVAIVGFNGQLDVLLLRWLAGPGGARIVFAPLVSVTETLVDDRGVYRAGSIAARLLAALDRLTCRAADVVVADTHAHRQYFVERLGVIRRTSPSATWESTTRCSLAPVPPRQSVRRSEDRRRPRRSSRCSTSASICRFTGWT
jgi:hypothetical protein